MTDTELSEERVRQLRYHYARPEDAGVPWNATLRRRDDIVALCDYWLRNRQGVMDVAEIREAAMQDCWNAIDDLIVEGKVAAWRAEQRNGLVLATNAITALIDKERALTPPTRATCETCNDRGEIGGHIGQTPESFDYVTEPCPDCQQAKQCGVSEERLHNLRSKYRGGIERVDPIGVQVIQFAEVEAMAIELQRLRASAAAPVAK